MKFTNANIDKYLANIDLLVYYILKGVITVDIYLKDFGFLYSHKIDKTVEPAYFKLHNHRDSQEIYIFIKGNADFFVEGTIYPLHPYDIILAQNFEMHHVRHNDLSEYERIVISLDNNFFIKHNCEKYKEIFSNRPLGVNNRIPSEAAHKYGISELLKRTENYLNDGSNGETAALCTVIELLYLLNRVGNKSDKYDFYDEQLKDIILYINDHLTENIRLDDISSAFFISKGHLCRSFKKHTGYTVNQYITHKRLMLARELVSQGKSWLEASEAVGFGNYSSFYKVFCHTYGKSPTNKC